MAYLYRHIRLDKKEVFYIGIGSDKNKYRAKNKKARNQYWKNIVNQTEYNIEILFDNITWEEACRKEIEFIRLYGRKDKGLGTLVNMTDGGEGRLGSQDVVTPIYKFDLKGNFIKEYRNVLSISKNKSARTTLYLALNGTRLSSNNAIWIYKKDFSKEKLKYILEEIASWKKLKSKNTKTKKAVLQYDLSMNFIQEYESITEASKISGVSQTAISNNVKGKYKKTRNYIWKLK